MPFDGYQLLVDGTLLKSKKETNSHLDKMHLLAQDQRTCPKGV